MTFVLAHKSAASKNNLQLVLLWLDDENIDFWPCFLMIPLVYIIDKKYYSFQYIWNWSFDVSNLYLPTALTILGLERHHWDFKNTF